ncbi:MAG: prepilin peptidase [Candidatus Sericytochromatia bacterium]|nr:MAG: prepilin peptidase [Candidatus Sericytochromatia bacterium]
MITINHWTFYLLLIPLVIAIYTDIKKHKIYNWLTFPTLIVGLILHSINWGFLSSFLGFLIAFLVSLFLYAGIKFIAGGDVKLIAAIGAWVGKSLILNTLVWIFLCGGLLSLFQILRAGTFYITINKIKDFFIALIIPGMKATNVVKESVNEYVPYGIAISIGTILSIKYPNILGI